MGNSKPTSNGTDSGAGVFTVLIGVASLFVALYQSRQQESSTAQQAEWRTEDQAESLHSAHRSEGQHAEVIAQLSEVNDGVRSLQSPEEPPLVLATVVKDKVLPALRRASTRTGTPAKELHIAGSGISLIAASNQPLIEVNATWLVDGKVEAIAVSHGVLSAGKEIPLEQFPAIQPQATTRGVLRIEFSNSLGFHGVVDHPFLIRKCVDHIHVTIDAHTSQSWLGPTTGVLTN